MIKIYYLEKNKSIVQSIIFDKNKFTEKQAKDWAKDNNFKFGKVDEKEDTWRLRQVDPDQFKSFRTSTIKGVSGVKFIYGIK